MKTKDQLSKKAIERIDDILNAHAEKWIHENNDSAISIEDDFNIDGYTYLIMEGRAYDNTSRTPETRDEPSYLEGDVEYIFHSVRLQKEDEEEDDFNPSDFNDKVKKWKK
jgi:hypothetical protein